jgi:hypothetical protein
VLVFLVSLIHDPVKSNAGSDPMNGPIMLGTSIGAARRGVRARLCSSLR